SAPTCRRCHPEPHHHTECSGCRPGPCQATESPQSPGTKYRWSYPSHPASECPGQSSKSSQPLLNLLFSRQLKWNLERWHRVTTARKSHRLGQLDTAIGVYDRERRRQHLVQRVQRLRCPIVRHNQIHLSINRHRTAQRL